MRLPELSVMCSYTSGARNIKDLCLLNAKATRLYLQDDELTIIDVRKFKAIHKRKFTYEVC